MLIFSLIASRARATTSGERVIPAHVAFATVTRSYVSAISRADIPDIAAKMPMVAAAQHFGRAADARAQFSPHAELLSMMRRYYQRKAHL